jgi:tRNA (guanine37-N1)-methyltransferase
MTFDIITIFPEILDSYFSKGMIRIAREKKIIKIKTHDLRKFAVDKHGTVDDKPYGGGPGQVLMVEPVVQALRHIKKARNQEIKKSKKQENKKLKVILLSAKGKKWNQQVAQRFSKFNQLIFICPRYEGHDERIKKFVDEEISIGDYVLTGGELGAAVIIDSITRLLPGVLGEPDSLKTESHSTPGYLEYPQYTRPAVFEYLGNQEIKKSRKQESKKTRNQEIKKTRKQKLQKLTVPRVLLSGDHKRIALWRERKSQKK